MIEDVIEIEQLLNRYCHAVDRGSVSDIMDVFHRDAVLLPRYQSEESFKGQDAVRGWYENYEKTVTAQTRTLRHKISTPMIQLSGNLATSVCYLDLDWIADSGGTFQILGQYQDKLIKEEGRWWIAERIITVEETLIAWPR